MRTPTRLPEKARRAILADYERIMGALRPWVGMPRPVRKDRHDLAWRPIDGRVRDWLDLNFLRMISSEANYEFNVRGQNVVFYSRAALDAQAPANRITMNMVTRYELRYQSRAEQTYGTSTLGYLDPFTKQVFSATAKTSGAAPTADTLNIEERVENNEQAALKAASRLYETNMLATQLTILLPGTTVFRAGQTAALPPEDWGVFGRS